MKYLKYLVLFFAVTSITACGKKAKNDWLVAPPVKHERVGESTKNVKNPQTPKIEILFVIDNSKSMDVHIANLSNNIDQFVDALGTNLPFPYHVGVTTVYDSRGAKSATLSEPGQLVPVKSSATDIVADKYFVSSEDKDAKELLRHTLKVGTLDLKDGGPEVEELFTPVASFYGFGPQKQSAALVAKQKSFFLGVNTYKVIFFISDAADNSTITSTELVRGLRMMAGGDKSKVLAFGASIHSATSSCKADPGMKNSKLNDFLALARTSQQNNTLDLCSSDFGRRLAQAGSQIRQETMTRLIHVGDDVFPPDYTVDPNSPNYAQGEGIWVTYGTEQDTLKRQRLLMKVSLDQKNYGYIYDPSRGGIVINPDFVFDIKPGADLRIEYFPILESSIKQGRVKPWTPAAKK